MENAATKKPKDYVIATGKEYSVKEFIEKCCKFLNIKIYWKGKGLNEAGYVKSYDPTLSPALKNSQKIIQIDKSYFRPVDVNFLKGDATKARKDLKWKPKISLDQLVNEMMSKDLKALKRF